MESTNLYHVAAAIVGVIFPLYAILNGKKARQLLIEDPNAKILVFRQTGIILIVLATISLLPFLLNNKSLDLIGLNFINTPLWVIGLFGLSFLILFVLKSVKLNETTAKKFYKTNKEISFLMPNTKPELNITIIVSFIAGICEEIIYRGFLFWYLHQYMSLIPAMIFANLPFALGHLTTTGKKNTFGAFILAFIFSGAYFLTNSLWLPILLHIIVDLYAMAFAYKSYQVINTTETDN
ncbi:CPBP family intramembrane glutamic endopeptidase [uncultured Psychroserpens sp.]|uniref:CPBP family intramembrane glutamic endopeptidase n=1 Tax=uncultured Psychroserpens sp. TaxID=255436 RepID=UPI00260E719C|nr:CPBP family intramembrane glutamic endopeptidase [uncultured Psychroserpens sp.]